MTRDTPTDRDLQFQQQAAEFFHLPIQILRCKVYFGPGVEHQEFIRADGNCICKTCGNYYRNHVLDGAFQDWQDNYWLHILCDGTRVKL